MHAQVDKFAFIPGYKQHKLDAEDPINIKAVVLLGELHDVLKAGGYSGHALERFLVRVLFCLFAEDTGLFERNAFTAFIENHTKADGNDLGANLARLFQALNTPVESRQPHLLEELAELPYVNGDLFSESLGFVDCDRDMRNRLIACCRFDWSRISPAVFGSLFQSVMEPIERRQVGAHYTSERDILKVVRSLFLDDLRAEFGRLAANQGTQRKSRLKEFHERLGQLKFLDPACGCGNFLVVTYRELRLLEIEVLKQLYGRQKVTDIHLLSVLDVDAMHGIEIVEFPARIAEVALWLVDHQMNQRLSEEFGQYFVRLPLRKSARIIHANALRTDWNDVLAIEQCTFVLGNPPWVGKHLKTDEQSSDMQLVWGDLNGAGVLDYVTAWYRKSVSYISGSVARVAFVSTNSISQGEQVAVMWTPLIAEGVHINFAHRTFNWESEARGAAHVHAVIIGFSFSDNTDKSITDYSSRRNDDGSMEVVGMTHAATRISPYLIEGANVLIHSRSTPLCKVPPSSYGSKPNDGGFLIVEENDRVSLLESSPAAVKFLRPLLCTDEYLDGVPRWCLWLVDAHPNEWRHDTALRERVNHVREVRLKSKKIPTQKAADSPSVFAEIRQPQAHFLVIPQHTSHKRNYIPFGFFPPSHIVHNSCTAIPDATNFHVGVLSSSMHMAWVRHICGRIKSAFRYSTRLVYNNFPWPQALTDKQVVKVESSAQAVLDARAKFPEASLADLYDPLTMPASVQKAHTALDSIVERCYRTKPFEGDCERMEFLFALYEKLTVTQIP